MIRTSRAFTLIELLVVVGIIALLIAILLPSLAKAKALARRTRTASDMHQMLLAYHEYTTDNAGHLLLGFLPDSVNWTVHDTQYNLTISGHPATRYPWRLLPYIRDWRILFSGSALSSDSVDAYSYQLSLLPHFGLNSVYVGGDHEFNGFNNAGNPNLAGPAVFLESQVHRPANLIVFAETGCFSAGKPFLFPDSTLPPGSPAEDLQHYFQLQPPLFGSTRIWQSAGGKLSFTSNAILGAPWSTDSNSPVAGFFDGHAEAVPLAAYDDMQLWSNNPNGQ